MRLQALTKLVIDFAKGCLFGEFANKVGTLAGEQVTNDKEKKVWTGFAGSIVSQAGLVYALENKRWCKTGLTVITAKVIALITSAFPSEKIVPAYIRLNEPLQTENKIQFDKPWHKLISLGAGGTVAFQATKRFGPVWGLVIGNLVAGVPVRV